MIRSRRFLILCLGLLIGLCALSALTYALLPVETLREQFRPAPTFFVAPQ
jgi:hypothetical protein